MEEWKAIPGFEGRYEASTHGRVRSLNFRGNTGEAAIMRPSRNYAGYMVLTLSRDEGPRKQYRLHRIILLTFVGPCPEGMEALHGDDDKGNNRLSNLRWGTQQDNIDQRGSEYMKGERNCNHKITDAMKREIIHRRGLGEGVDSIAYDFGVSNVRVSQLYRRRHKRN